MGESTILERNKLDKYSSVVLTHGGTSADLFDRDMETVYTTSGANSDATQARIEITFKDSAGVNIARSVDSFFFGNFNFKNFLVEYWTGAAWASMFADTTNTDTNYYRTVSIQSTIAIRISCTETITPDEEKKVGELIISAVFQDISEEISSYNLQFHQKSNIIQLSDGGLHVSLRKFTTNRTQKYGARVSFKLIDETLLERFRTLKDSGNSFYWYPEKTSRPNQIYFVNWVTPLIYRYTSSYKGAGFTVEMELREV